MKHKNKDIFFYYFIQHDSKYKFEYFFDENYELSNALVFEYPFSYNSLGRMLYILISDKRLPLIVFSKSQESRPSCIRFFRKYTMIQDNSKFNNYFYGVCLEQYGNCLTNIRDLREKTLSVIRLLCNELR